MSPLAFDSIETQLLALTNHLLPAIDSLSRLVAEKDSELKVAIMSAVPDTIVRVAASANMPPEAWYEKALVQTFIGGALALIGGFVVELWRTRTELERMKQRVMWRIRSALEAAAYNAQFLLRNRNETNQMSPAKVNEIILEWRRYDRVSDDIGLLKDSRMAELVDSTLAGARMVAEAVLEDERRFHEMIKMAGEVNQFEIYKSMIEEIDRQRKKRLEEVEVVGIKAQSVLDSFNEKWKPAPWHEERQGPEAEQPEPPPSA